MKKRAKQLGVVAGIFSMILVAIMVTKVYEADKSIKKALKR